MKERIKGGMNPPPPLLIGVDLPPNLHFFFVLISFCHDSREGFQVDQAPFAALSLSSHLPTHSPHTPSTFSNGGIQD